VFKNWIPIVELVRRSAKRRASSTIIAVVLFEISRFKEFSNTPQAKFVPVYSKEARNAKKPVAFWRFFIRRKSTGSEMKNVCR
jgi:hypothetical protein